MDQGDDRPTIAHVLHRMALAGAEVLARDLSRDLSDRYRFVFLCLDEAGPMANQLIGEGFKVVDLKRRPGIDLGVARRTRQAVKRYGIDLIHAHQYTPFFYASLSRLLGSQPRVIFTEHGRHYPDIRKPKRVFANRFLLRRSDRVTAVGEFVRDMLVENEGIPAGQIDVIHNGIDPDTYGQDTGPEARQAAREAMGVGPDAAVVLHVARFHSVKDHETAIEAFTRVAEAMPNAVYVMAGDGEQRSAIEAIATSRGLDPQVRFLGVRDDVSKLLPGADVFMLSSLSEGISVTLLEAMAARLPIAATAVGGNAEVVAHGQTGLLSPRQDSEGLAHNLLLLLRDPAMRERMGDAGRARLEAHFTQARMHADYAAIYEEMLGQA